MKKAFLYLFLFVVIMGVAAFGFFTMTTPHIAQETVSKTLDPKDAFAMQTPATPATIISVPQNPAPIISAPATPVPAATGAPE